MTTPSVDATGRRFELQRTLGVGSFGSVYLAEMESSGGFRRRVALKLLHPNWDPGSDASRRLRDEARLLGRLQHRHIVRVDDLIRLEGRWALVMEYVPGVDLEAIVSPPPGSTTVGAVPVRGALEIIAAVASALREAANSPDSNGRPLAVVHRDIKPSNVRITETGEVKVLDFGVARADFAGRESKTERVRYGSLGYMAPERLLGGDETSAGDVFSLGVVLYELCLRTTYGRSELGEDAQMAQVKNAADALAVVAGPEVAELFQSCLRYEQEARPGALEVEEIARRLSAARGEIDLPSWCLANVPLLAGGLPPGGEEGVTGRIMAEAEQAGRAIVNSATLAVPEGADWGVGGSDDAGASRVGEMTRAPGQRAASGPTGATASETLVLEPEAPAKVGGSKRMAAIVGGILLFTLGAVVVGYLVQPPGEPDPAPSADAAVPVEPATAAVSAAPAPTEAPDAALATAPEAAAPEAAAVAAVPLPRSTTASRPVATAVPESEAASAPAPTEVARLRSAKFAVDAADQTLSVVCGDVRATGTGNALVQSFPAGRCTVTVAGSSTTVDVQTPRKVDCTLSAGSLSCR